MLVRQAISQLASSYTEDQILRYFGFLFSHVMSSSTVQTLFCSKQMLVAPESCTVVCVCGGGVILPLTLRRHHGLPPSQTFGCSSSRLSFSRLAGRFIPLLGPTLS